MGEELGVDADTTVGVLNPTTIWEEKDKWLEEEKANLEWWNTQMPEQRELILEVVSRSLERMQDRLDLWVPASLGVKQGEYLECKFRILFTDLERELAAKLEITDRKIEKAKQEASQMLSEFDSHPNAIGDENVEEG